MMLVVWLAVCPLFWALRDGLGPHAVETAGWASVRKSAPVLLVGLVRSGMLAVAFLVPNRKKERGSGGRLV